MRRIANPPKGGWSIDQKKFVAWLASNSELRIHFEPFIDEIEVCESLTIKPNKGFMVVHNSERISPPPFTIRQEE